MAGVPTSAEAVVGPPSEVSEEHAKLRVERLREVLEQYPAMIERLTRKGYEKQAEEMRANQVLIESRLTELDAIANPTPESRRADLERRKAEIDAQLADLPKPAKGK